MSELQGPFTGRPSGVPVQADEPIDARAGPGARPRPVQGDGRARMDDRSVGQLLREMAHEGERLIRQEVELAKAEVREKVSVYERNVTAIAVGAGLLVVALLLAGTALNHGLTVWLTGVVGLETAVWLAPLILTVLFGLMGYGIVMKGMRALRTEGVVPNQSMESLRQDAHWIRRRVAS